MTETGTSTQARPGLRAWQWGLMAVLALVGGLVAGGLMRPAQQQAEGALITAPSGTQYRAYQEMGRNAGEDFALDSARGGSMGLADFGGKVLLVFFGYTNCPDVCPTTLLAMRQVEAALETELGDVSDRFQGVFVSVDPARDTPQRLAAYVDHFDEDFAALSGTPAAIDRAAALFGARYQVHEADANGNYLVDHSTLGYLVGPSGRVWAVYPGAGDWQGMLDGARDLLSVDWSKV